MKKFKRIIVLLFFFIIISYNYVKADIITTMPRFNPYGSDNKLLRFLSINAFPIILLAIIFVAFVSYYLLKKETSEKNSDNKIFKYFKMVICVLLLYLSIFNLKEHMSVFDDIFYYIERFFDYYILSYIEVSLVATIIVGVAFLAIIFGLIFLVLKLNIKDTTISIITLVVLSITIFSLMFSYNNSVYGDLEAVNIFSKEVTEVYPNYIETRFYEGKTDYKSYIQYKENEMIFSGVLFGVIAILDLISLILKKEIKNIYLLKVLLSCIITDISISYIHCIEKMHFTIGDICLIVSIFYLAINNTILVINKGRKKYIDYFLILLLIVFTVFIVNFSYFNWLVPIKNYKGF